MFCILSDCPYHTMALVETILSSEMGFIGVQLSAEMYVKSMGTLLEPRSPVFSVVGAVESYRSHIQGHSVQAMSR